MADLEGVTGCPGLDRIARGHFESGAKYVGGRRNIIDLLTSRTHSWRWQSGVVEMLAFLVVGGTQVASHITNRLNHPPHGLIATAPDCTAINEHLMFFFQN